MARRNVTLHDVARLAGVSPTTASYILNDRSAQMRIAADTQERVRRAASDLGYRPNRSAQSLRTASTKTIGLISDFVASGHYASRMLTGASAAAQEADHLLVIGESEGDPRREADLIEEMIDRQVDAFVFATLSTAEVEVPASLAWRRAVLLNCIDPGRSLPAVLPNEFEGGRSAADLLRRAGVDRGLWVVGEETTADALAGRERVEGVRARLEADGISLSGRVECAWDVGPAYAAVSDWLAGLSRRSRPRGLVCLNDRIAMGTYQALAEAGLDVPGDVSVVSFDGSELAGWLRPRLTSVVIPYADLGAAAVRALVDPDGGAGAASGSRIVRMPMPVSPGGSIRMSR